MKRYAPFGAAAVALTGCSGSLLQSDAPVDRLYTIRVAAPTTDASSVPLDVSLSVARPRVAPGLGSERIAVRTDRNEIDYFRAARWGDSAADVVQSLFVDSLRRSGRFALVVPDDAPVAATHLVDLELRDFQAEQMGGATPVARFSIVATLIEISERRPLTSFEVAVEVPAEANRLGAVVAAMERAANDAASELAQRLDVALRGSRAAAAR